MNTTEHINDIAGKNKSQYNLSEAEARMRLKEQGCQNELPWNLEQVDMKYAEAFEWDWKDFDERFEEALGENPWSV